MGGRSSKEGSWRQNSTIRSSSSSWGGYSQSPYDQDIQSYSAQQSFSSPQYVYPPQQDYDVGHAAPGGRRLDRRYSKIADNYNSLEQVKINRQYFFFFVGYLRREAKI